MSLSDSELEVRNWSTDAAQGIIELSRHKMDKSLNEVIAGQRWITEMLKGTQTPHKHISIVTNVYVFRDI